MTTVGSEKEEDGQTGKQSLQRSYKTMNLALRNRNEATELRKLLKQLEREETYVQKRINIDIRLVKVRYRKFLPTTKEEQEDTELIFRSIREPCKKKSLTFSSLSPRSGASLSTSRSAAAANNNSLPPLQTKAHLAPPPPSKHSTERIDKVIRVNSAAAADSDVHLLNLPSSTSSGRASSFAKPRASFSKSAPSSSETNRCKRPSHLKDLLSNTFMNKAPSCSKYTM